MPDAPVKRTSSIASPSLPPKTLAVFSRPPGSTMGAGEEEGLPKGQAPGLPVPQDSPIVVRASQGNGFWAIITIPII